MIIMHCWHKTIETKEQFGSFNGRDNRHKEMQDNDTVSHCTLYLNVRSKISKLQNKFATKSEHMEDVTGEVEKDNVVHMKGKAGQERMDWTLDTEKLRG